MGFQDVHGRNTCPLIPSIHFRRSWAVLSKVPKFGQGRNFSIVLGGAAAVSDMLASCFCAYPKREKMLQECGGKRCALTFTNGAMPCLHGLSMGSACRWNIQNTALMKFPMDRKNIGLSAPCAWSASAGSHLRVTRCRWGASDQRRGHTPVGNCSTIPER